MTRFDIYIYSYNLSFFFLTWGGGDKAPDIGKLEAKQTILNDDNLQLIRRREVANDYSQFRETWYGQKL